MTVLQRIQRIFEGLVMLAFGALMITDTETGYLAVTAVLSLTLCVYGLRSLIYYFRMARYMVDGRYILFRGILILDLGLFTASLTAIPRVYVLLYLLGIHAFAGAVDLMRAMEAKRLEARSWKRGLVTAAVNLGVAVACLFCFRSERLLVIIYCAGLAVSACARILSAFRKTAIVYIP